MHSQQLVNLPQWDGVYRLEPWLGLDLCSKDEILAAAVSSPPLGVPATGLAVCFMRRPYQADIGLVFFDPARLPAP